MMHIMGQLKPINFVGMRVSGCDGVVEKVSVFVKIRCYHNRVDNGVVDEEFLELKVLTTRIW